MNFSSINDSWNSISERFSTWSQHHFSGNNIPKGMRSYLNSSVHANGMEWVKWNFGIDKGAKGLGRLMGPALLAYSAYSGYKQGGVVGAVKEGGKSIGESYVFGAVTKALGGGPAFAGLAIGIPTMMASMSAHATGGSPIALWARPWVREHTRGLNRLEMGVPINDQFGTIATSRQRAVQAIQSSRVNGRSALGNEAALMYQPYFR